MNHSHSSKSIPAIDLECCILCEVCVDIAPQAFNINDAGFIELLPLDDYEGEDIRDAVNNCPRDCITWE